MITDDIGIWNNLGSIQTQIRTWVKIPTTSTSQNETFRAYFECDDWDKLRAYVLIRARYTTANTDQVCIPIRVFPSLVPVVFEIPMLREFADRSIYFRNLEVYKVNRRRPKLVGITLDVNLQIRIEELWG